MCNFFFRCPKFDAERRGMHSHAERGNEKKLGDLRRVLSYHHQGSRSHALRGNACCDALRRVLSWRPNCGR